MKNRGYIFIGSILIFLHLGCHFGGPQLNKFDEDQYFKFSVIQGDIIKYVWGDGHRISIQLFDSRGRFQEELIPHQTLCSRIIPDPSNKLIKLEFSVSDSTDLYKKGLLNYYNSQVDFLGEYRVTGEFKFTETYPKAPDLIFGNLSMLRITNEELVEIILVDDRKYRIPISQVIFGKESGRGKVLYAHLLGEGGIIEKTFEFYLPNNFGEIHRSFLNDLEMIAMKNMNS